ncbi:MAG TPA: sugar ABC transporter substrate-binding protein, partial [Dongiaceae bacterium]
MKMPLRAAIGGISLIMASQAMAQTTLTVATVNNSDMIRMQRLTGDFTAKNPGVTLKWVTLEENVLRLRVITDI